MYFPILDRVLVSLDCQALHALIIPSQAGQQPQNTTGHLTHLEQIPDHMSNSVQRPIVFRISMSVGAFQQFPFQLFDLLFRQVPFFPRSLACSSSSDASLPLASDGHCVRTLRSVVPNCLAISLSALPLSSRSKAFWRRFASCFGAPRCLMLPLSYNLHTPDIFISELNRPKLTWENVRNRVVQTPKGLVVFDDTVADKDFSHKIELVRRQYSGNAHGVIKGLGIVTCVYVNPELDQFWIIDYRIYDPDRDGKTKLDHVQDMFLN
jgi:hypothetical protein